MPSREGGPQGRIGAIALGIGAALAVPFWLGKRRIARLLADPPSPPKRSGDARAALRVSRGAIRRLASIPLSPWRNTCLYRSVADCLILRACGHPARLRLGVRRGDAAGGAIQAHAWVEIDHAAVEEASYQPFNGAERMAAQ